MIPQTIQEKITGRNQTKKLLVFLLLFFILLNIGLWKVVASYRNQVALSSVSSNSVPKLNQTNTKEALFTQRIKLETKCPDERAGNPEASLTFKYFYSPVCPWCLIEDQNLDELLKTRGNLFQFEKYSRENCYDLLAKYKFSLVPSFVFSTKNSSQEYTHEGYISKEDFKKIICKTSNQC